MVRKRRDDYYRDRRRRKVCAFCADNSKTIDYKEVNRLRRYISERAKIEPRRKTGTCAQHQRALAVALSPLPLRAVLIDQREAELKEAPPGAETRLSALPEAEVDAARPGAAFVILTHDHALDFLIAEAALARGDAAYVGMIGSATKRATFENALRREGRDAPHSLICPIGVAGLGDKRPAVIAAHAAAEIAAALFAVKP